MTAEPSSSFGDAWRRFQEATSVQVGLAGLKKRLETLRSDRSEELGTLAVRQVEFVEARSGGDHPQLHVIQPIGLGGSA